MSFKTVSAILRGKWLIDGEYVNSHLPYIVSLLKGEKGGFETPSVKEKEGTVAHAGSGVTLYTSNRGDYSNAPKGSLALVNITGPILKYGDYCSYGSVEIVNNIHAADQSPLIDGIIVRIDSPGGQVDGTATLADAIKNCKKPIVAFIDDGMACSAGYWIASAANKIYSSHVSNTIGSVGVYCTIYDFKSFMEHEGLPVHEIYAPQSTNKNIGYKEALKGDYTKVQKELSEIAKTFISSVKTNRPASIEFEKEWNTGATFNSEEAIMIGLIDEVKSLEEVALSLMSDIENKNTKKQNNNMFGMNKFSKLAALAGKEAVSAEEVEAANDELESRNISGVALVSAAEYATMTQAVKDLNAANERITELETEIKNIGESAASAHSAVQPSAQDDEVKFELDAESQRTANAIM